MNEQIKAGSDIHAGDGGYSIGTKEKYEEFAKARNKSLANARIRELAEQAGSTHKQNLGVYQFYTDELEKFAELIVRECSKIVLNCSIPGSNTERDFIVASREIKHHFGVEE
jgi:hypothetical protein